MQSLRSGSDVAFPHSPSYLLGAPWYCREYRDQVSPSGYFMGASAMTDLEENCWSECCCQKCGSKLQGEQYLLNEGDTSKAYCSRLCYDDAEKALKLSVSIFIAPSLMRLRDDILAPQGAQART